MEIRNGDISIGGNVEVITAQLELFKGVINKQESYSAKLRFNMKVSCEVDGVAIEPFYTERLFELSKNDFDKMKEKGIITIK